MKNGNCVICGRWLDWYTTKFYDPKNRDIIGCPEHITIIKNEEGVNVQVSKYIDNADELEWWTDG